MLNGWDTAAPSKRFFDIMLTVEDLLKRIKQPNNPSWLLVGVDSKDEGQLKIAVNGGMGNIICTSIDRYPPEIKACVLAMIDEGALYLESNVKPYQVSQTQSVFFYTLKK